MSPWHALCPWRRAEPASKLEAGSRRHDSRAQGNTTDREAPWRHRGPPASGRSGGGWCGWFSSSGTRWPSGWVNLLNGSFRQTQAAEKDGLTGRYDAIPTYARPLLMASDLVGL